MLEEAIAQADRLIEENADTPVLLLGSEAYHKGIVGLVASRLVERFQRPACVIAWDAAGEGTGSLRSIDGIDIGSAVRAAVAGGLLRKGGGHAMAAGLTVARDQLSALAAYFHARLAAKTSAVRCAAFLDIDGALTPSAVNDELIGLIERAGPYGQSNPQPRFAFPAHRVKFAKVVGDAHVRCVLEAGDGSRLDGVAFRAANQPVGGALLRAAGFPLHVAGHIRRDTWNGRDRRELVIEDVADPRQQG
jgi:single-stranded-DNA-specific exonuclease